MRARASSVASGRHSFAISSTWRAIRRRDPARVPRLMRAVVEPVRARGAFPEVEHRRDVLHFLLDVEQAGSGDHRAAEQGEVGNRPQPHGIDHRREVMPRVPELFGRNRICDLLHHRRVAPVALDTRDDDVCGNGDQRRFQSRALHRQRVRDLAVVPEPLVAPIAIPPRAERLRHDARRTTPSDPLQSISIASPSVGSASENTADITHGTWYSRLTIPMCDSGVPERQTTAVSSSKMGARKVAPASATHATTPSAEVSISASTSSGDDRRRQTPRTGDAANTRTPTARSNGLSLTSGESNSVPSAPCSPTRGTCSCTKCACADSS